MQIARCLLLVSVVISAQSYSCEFSSELWPGEGRPVFKTTSQILKVFDSPQSAAVPLELSIEVGSKIEFTETFYCTVATGEIRTTDAVDFEGRVIEDVGHLTAKQYYSAGPSLVTFRLEEGSNVEYVQYRAEGSCFVRIDGALIEANICTHIDGHAVELVREPKTEWWIKITLEGSTGWVLYETSKVRIAKREF